MSITNLTAQAVFDPDRVKEKILHEADALDFETRPLAGVLGVSYPTLLRVLRRLDLHEHVRSQWLQRRKAKRERGHNGKKTTGSR